MRSVEVIEVCMRPFGPQRCKGEKRGRRDVTFQWYVSAFFASFLRHLAPLR